MANVESLIEEKFRTSDFIILLPGDKEKMAAVVRMMMMRAYGFVNERVCVLTAEQFNGSLCSEEVEGGRNWVRWGFIWDMMDVTVPSGLRLTLIWENQHKTL